MDIQVRVTQGVEPLVKGAVVGSAPVAEHEVIEGTQAPDELALRGR